MRMIRARAGARLTLLLGFAPTAALAQSAGASASISPASISPASTRASASVPAKRAPHSPVELGFFGGAFFPSDNHSLVGSNRVQEPFKSPAPEIGARVAVLPSPYGGLEAEGAVMPAKTESGEAGGLSALRGHLIGQYPLGTFTPFAVAGLGSLSGTSSTTGTGRDLAWHFGVGAKVAIDDFLGLRLDVRDTLSDELGGSGQTHNPEVLLGLTFKVGASTKAPPPPEPAVVDTDADGKPDADDKCPEEAAATEDGCPIRDSDGDGTFDAKDACPNEVGGAPCGCPPRDQDGDKVIDELDKCPDVAGPIAGCPDPDADRDGVALPDDKCPDKPETRNGFEDTDGCPDEVPEKVKKFTGVIQGIEFDRGKDTIRPVSTTALDAAATVLAEYPALRLVISGHTDTDGERSTNVELSRRRAESVKAYFVSKGVDAGRIETRGAGPDEPIAENKTAAGRQKNRRIEFKLKDEATAPVASPAVAP